MPTKVEKDIATGKETTGHEWDGIKELNNPLPKWWLYLFYATIAVSVVIWILFPSWPGFTGHFGGVLGYSQRETVQRDIEAARAGQLGFLDRVEQASLEEITQQSDLLNFAIAGGRAAFGDNCATCHGQGGAGQSGGFPSLADDSWLWGGDLESIHQTLLYGIRFDHEDTRFSEMPAFGEILGPEEIDAVAEYVLSLSGQAENEEAAKQGAEIFAEQCAACHGEAGEGMVELGAPRLSDQIWLYGGTKEQVVAQIRQPQHGVMPAWVDRLDPETIKMLAVYVHSLGGGE
jgi:cytochrome c oxidase cbb3-type subunit 3